MKNLSLILNGVLLVAVAVLFFLVISIKKQLAPATDSDENQVPMAQEGIVYVDIDSVMAKYSMSTDVTNELQGKLKVSEDQLAAKERSLRKEMEDYQYKMERGLLTRSQAEQVQQGLAGKEQEYFQLQNKLQMQLAEEQQVAQRKVLDAITQHLKALEGSSKNNYQYILGYSFGGSILYANEGLNITKAVINGLNEQYDKTKTEQED